MAVLRNRTTGAILAERIAVVEAQVERIVRLFHPQVSDLEGRWFDQCEAVHTLGMNTIVDLLFLDRLLRVIKVEHAVRPSRPLVWCRGASSVLQMDSGFLARTDILAGDALTIEHPPTT